MTTRLRGVDVALFPPDVAVLRRSETVLPARIDAWVSLCRALIGAGASLRVPAGGPFAMIAGWICGEYAEPEEAEVVREESAPLLTLHGAEPKAVGAGWLAILAGTGRVALDSTPLVELDMPSSSTLVVVGPSSVARTFLERRGRDWNPLVVGVDLDDDESGELVRIDKRVMDRLSTVRGRRTLLQRGENEVSLEIEEELPSWARQATWTPYPIVAQQVVDLIADARREGTGG